MLFSTVNACFLHVCSFCLQSTKLGETKRVETFTLRARPWCADVLAGPAGCPRQRRASGAAGTDAVISAKEPAGENVSEAPTSQKTPSFCSAPRFLVTGRYLLSTVLRGVAAGSQSMSLTFTDVGESQCGHLETGVFSPPSSKTRERIPLWWWDVGVCRQPSQAANHKLDGAFNDTPAQPDELSGIRREVRG